jgi:DNA-binding NarL/FixJ family response regulator
VRKHLEHVYSKLGVATRTQAAAKVLELSLASSDAAPTVREMVRRMAATEPAAVYALTAREIEVLARASAGETNAAIAAGLHVTPETIKRHLDHIYDKLGVRRRSEATGRALSLGLV